MTPATNWRSLDLSTSEGRDALNREIARRRNQDPAETYDYANSVDAALALVSNPGYVMKMTREKLTDIFSTWIVELRDGDTSVGVNNPSPALAICCAWLAMMDENGGAS